MVRAPKSCAFQPAGRNSAPSGQLPSYLVDRKKRDAGHIGKALSCREVAVQQLGSFRNFTSPEPVPS